MDHAQILIVEVWVPLPFRTPLSYLFDPALAPDGAAPRRGARVVVSVNNRRLVGIVDRTSQATAQNDCSRLRPVETVLDTIPLLAEQTLDLMLWTARYYCSAAGELLQLALPPALRTSSRLQQSREWLTVRYWRLGRAPTEEASGQLQGRKQRELLTALQTAPAHQIEHGHLRSLGFGKAQFTALETAGLIEEVIMDELAMEAAKGEEEPQAASDGPPAGHTLNNEQKATVEAIVSSDGKFAAFLLDGLTGSGKTEVYLAALDRLIAEGRQALILVPEISLTPQLTARFEKRFPGLVCVYHSGLTDKQRLLAWNDIRLKKKPVVVGTRSAIFLSFTQLALVVVDEEHDSSFKQQDNCRFNARDLAVVRASNQSCPVVLGSATPSLESLQNAESGRYQLLRLRHRTAAFARPQIELVNIRSRKLTGGLSDPAARAILDTLQARRQVLVFLNRRGYAPALFCQSCGWIAGCSRCDSRMTLHRHDASLRCHHCDLRLRLPTNCPECTSGSLVPLGSGTEHAEEALQALVGDDIPVIRVDRDTIGSTSALHDKLELVKAGEPCVLLGTQMLAKGHDFPDLTLAVILDADGALFSGDLRASERAMQLLTQVCGRVGRGEHAGRVLVQTRLPSHPLIAQLLAQDYRQFALNELELRRQLAMPPYSSMAVIRAEAASEAHLQQGLALLASQLKTVMTQQHLGDGVTVHGPFPAVLARKKNRHHGLLWLIASKRATLRSLITGLMSQPASPDRPRSRALQLPGRTGRHQPFSWSLDIDPYETL
ncbi:primosomal protein N' [Allohahella marinimesophila]|uniref:Replication restart protein PriA n=2 Tax=Allohahella marinimesophila TaxID=1054972 RepID=A0ABP7PJL0_9GAMM